MFQYISEHPDTTDIRSITVSSLLTFHDMTKAISQLKKKIEGFCKKEVEKVSDRGKVPVVNIY